MIKEIDEGHKHDKGTHVCPHCDKTVVIEKHFGDPPKCGDCDVPYRPISRIPQYY